MPAVSRSIVRYAWKRNGFSMVTTMVRDCLLLCFYHPRLFHRTLHSICNSSFASTPSLQAIISHSFILQLITLTSYHISIHILTLLARHLDKVTPLSSALQQLYHYSSNKISLPFLGVRHAPHQPPSPLKGRPECR